jgi:hypothetical protein
VRKEIARTGTAFFGEDQFNFKNFRGGKSESRSITYFTTIKFVYNEAARVTERLVSQ